MPRRSTPDPLAARVGARIRELRKARGLTLEKLAYETEIGSKGYVSDVEHGLALPTLKTLQAIADHLAVKLLDLVTFAEDDDRQRLIDHTRSWDRATVRRILRETAPAKK